MNAKQNLKVKLQEIKIKQNNHTKTKKLEPKTDKLVSDRIKKVRAQFDGQLKNTNTRHGDSKGSGIIMIDKEGNIISSMEIDRVYHERKDYINRINKEIEDNKPLFGKSITALLITSIVLLGLAYYLAS